MTDGSNRSEIVVSRLKLHGDTGFVMCGSIKIFRVHGPFIEIFDKNVLRAPKRGGSQHEYVPIDEVIEFLQRINGDSDSPLDGREDSD